MSENETDLRLDSPDNLVNKLRIEKLHSNRNGPRNIPPMIQTLAVALGELDSQKAAADVFGMSAPNVNYLTHEGKKVDRDLVKEKIGDVHSNALDSMLEAIHLIKPKLANVNKASELSRVAADLARVVEKTSPKEAGRANVMIVAYAPRQREEGEYETIDVPNS